MRSCGIRCRPYHITKCGCAETCIGMARGGPAPDHVMDVRCCASLSGLCLWVLRAIVEIWNLFRLCDGCASVEANTDGCGKEGKGEKGPRALWARVPALPTRRLHTLAWHTPADTAAVPHRACRMTSQLCTRQEVVARVEPRNSETPRYHTHTRLRAPAWMDAVQRAVSPKRHILSRGQWPVANSSRREKNRFVQSHSVRSPETDKRSMSRTGPIRQSSRHHHLPVSQANRRPMRRGI